MDDIQLDTNILIVDDLEDWRSKIASSLRRQGYTIQCTSSHGEALDLLCGHQSFDLAIINIILEGEVKPGWKLDWTTLLFEATKRGTSVIVLTVMKDVDVLKMAYEQFGVASVLFKQDLVQGQLEEKVRRTLEQRSRHPLPIPQEHEIGDRQMDWNTMISLAVSAVSPYGAAFALSTATAAGTKLGEAAFESIKEIWQWIRQTVSVSDEESDKQIWEGFKEDPQSNRDALADVIRRLSPDDDAVLRGYVQGLVQEVTLRKGAQLYSLLDNRRYYTFNDLKRICSRVSPQWEDDLGSNPAREAVARWVVNYAPTRNKQEDLIAAMLEVNPAVMLP